MDILQISEKKKPVTLLKTPTLLKFLQHEDKEHKQEKGRKGKGTDNVI